MSEKAKKGFKMPSSYTVLLIIIAFMAVMTWIIPAGAFVDGVYKSQPQNPQGIWDVLMAPIRASDRRSLLHLDGWWFPWCSQ